MTFLISPISIISLSMSLVHKISFFKNVLTMWWLSIFIIWQKNAFWCQAHEFQYSTWLSKSPLKEKSLSSKFPKRFNEKSIQREANLKKFISALEKSFIATTCSVAKAVLQTQAYKNIRGGEKRKSWWYLKLKRKYFVENFYASRFFCLMSTSKRKVSIWIFQRFSL